MSTAYRSCPLHTTYSLIAAYDVYNSMSSLIFFFTFVFTCCLLNNYHVSFIRFSRLYIEHMMDTPLPITPLAHLLSLFIAFRLYQLLSFTLLPRGMVSCNVIYWINNLIYPEPGKNWLWMHTYIQLSLYLYSDFVCIRLSYYWIKNKGDKGSIEKRLSAEYQPDYSIGVEITIILRPIKLAEI